MMVKDAPSNKKVGLATACARAAEALAGRFGLSTGLYPAAFTAILKGDTANS